MRSPWAAAVLALVITAGTGLAAAPQALAANNGLAVSAPLMGYQCPGSQGPNMDQYGRSSTPGLTSSRPGAWTT